MRIIPNPEVLQWAIRRCGKTPEDLMKAFPKIQEWLDGLGAPTFKQLEEFASRTHVSLASLLAADVPSMGLQIADFRTKDLRQQGLNVSEPSPELFDSIDHMMLRQEWMREYFFEEGYLPISFVGTYRGREKEEGLITEISEKMHEDLGMPPNWASSIRTYSDALKVFKDAVEKAGISVVINGVVKDNTQRKLSVEEFRGFVLADEIAPLVFINGQDAKSAQIFTLAHEVAHLYFASTGVVSPDADYIDLDEAELLCDAIAAEFLVPSESFLAACSNDQEDNYRAIKNASLRYKVSFTVCARKAKELNLIDKDTFFAYYYQNKEEVAALPEITKKPGGDFYRNKRYRLGDVFGEAIFLAVQARRLSYGEAFRLTGLNAKTFDSYFKGEPS